MTRTSVCALGRHPRGPRTASGASSSHIGRSEERSHPRLHRLPIDDQAATARNSGFLQSPSLDVAQGAALTAYAAIGSPTGRAWARDAVGGVWAPIGRWRVARSSQVVTRKPPISRGFLSSGRRDLNSGPLVPQTSALTRLRHAPWRDRIGYAL